MLRRIGGHGAGGRLLLGRPESLAQRPPALAFADELDVVGDPALFRGAVSPACAAAMGGVIMLSRYPAGQLALD